MRKSFSRESILEVRDILEAGILRDMLSELLSMKHSEAELFKLCEKYFQHPNIASKTWKKKTRPVIRKLLNKMDRFLIPPH